MLSQSLLPFIVSAEESAISIPRGCLINNEPFFLLLLSRFSHCVGFQHFTMICLFVYLFALILCDVFWAPWMYRFLFFSNSGEFFRHYFFKCFFCSVLFHLYFWYCHYMYVGVSCFHEALFTFLYPFSCSSTCIIFIGRVPRLHILSFAGSNLLLSPVMNF